MQGGGGVVLECLCVCGVDGWGGGSTAVAGWHSALASV